MYRFGLGMPFTADHVERSIAYAHRACDLGLAEGCTDVAVAYIEGGRDLAKAEALLTESCQRGQRSACVQLAAVQIDHLMPEAVAAKAFPLVEAECKAPSRPPPWAWRKSTESACEIAGRMLEAGRGVTKDVQRARATFAMACGGVPSSAVACELSRAPDGEPCELRAYVCRGTKEHSSSCVDGICEADLAIGAPCKDPKKKCAHGSYCNKSSPEPTCAAKKPIGAPCESGKECDHDLCQEYRCGQHRSVTQ